MMGMNVNRATQRRGGMMGGHRGGPQSMMKGEKAKDFKNTIKRLLSNLKRYKLKLFVVLILAVSSTAFTIIGPKLLGKATTKLFEGLMAKFSGRGDVDFKYIGNIILFVLTVYLVASLFNLIMGLIMTRISTDITYVFRKDISNKISRIPIKYFDKITHGEVLSRITNDVDTISQTLSQSLTQIITSLVSVIGVLIMMFSISWQMTLVALLILPLSMVFVAFIVKKSQVHFKKQQKILGNINGHVEEMFSGHFVMRAYNNEEKSINKFNKSNDELYNSAWKAQFLSGLMMPMMRFISNVGYVGISILGGWLAVKRIITIGDIQAFTQYINNFTRPIMQISNMSNILQQTAAAAERVYEFLDEEEETPDIENFITLDSVKGHVEFRNINFGYEPGKTIINNFSAVAEPGQKIAIVGPTGAGKTTIVKLLMRFYDLNSGDIFVDGESIKKFSRNSLRKNFGMVLQDAWLNNDTIMENIRFGREGATDQEVKDAAKSAHANHFIHTLPDGYNMLLNEETSNISQGQKQLLTIARAILADPKILILDEATSSIDTRTELLIQSAMDNLMKNRTSFVIAHRLSTIKNADLILVMNNGDIVETGKHNELLEKGGFYADLYYSQFEPEESLC